MNENQASTLDTLAEMLVGYKRELEATRHEHQLVRKELQEKIHRLDQANGENIGLKIAIKNLEDRLADCAKQKNAECTASEYQNIRNERDVFSLRMRELAAQNDRLEKMVMRLADEKTKLERLYQSSKEELFAAARKCDELTKERDALKKDLQVEVSRRLNQAICPTPGEIATAGRNAALEKELESVQNDRAKAYNQISELRKEKEHYEKVAQNVTNENHEQADKIIRLNQELSYLKSDNRYHKGHSHGYAEALAKVQDAVLKLRD